VVEMVQKLVLRNEVVKVKGRVKVITIKKDEFEKFLQLRKLRILDKEYEALMPPIDSLQKNTIDVNGLSVLLQQFVSMMIFNTGYGNGLPPAQMILTTQSGTITFSYTSNITINSQGVTVYLQIFQENGNFVYQYYYVGFDTTNASYSTSEVDLYAGAQINGMYNPGIPETVTSNSDTVRIAYTNIPFVKTSDSYLFIVWLIEFQNIPPYLVPFTPTLYNNANVRVNNLQVPFGGNSSITVFFNNGSCNFVCGGNCPSTGLSGFITFVQNNSVILEFPLTNSLGSGASNLEILLCTNTKFSNISAISGYVSSSLSPPVSGATVYVALATLTITYQVS